MIVFTIILNVAILIFVLRASKPLETKTVRAEIIKREKLHKDNIVFCKAEFRLENGKTKKFHIMLHQYDELFKAGSGMLLFAKQKFCGFHYDNPFDDRRHDNKFGSEYTRFAKKQKYLLSPKICLIIILVIVIIVIAILFYEKKIMFFLIVIAIDAYIVLIKFMARVRIMFPIGSTRAFLGVKSYYRDYKGDIKYSFYFWFENGCKCRFDTSDFIYHNAHEGMFYDICMQDYEIIYSELSKNQKRFPLNKKDELTLDINPVLAAVIIIAVTLFIFAMIFLKLHYFG